MKCLIIDAVHEAIAKELGRYMDVETRLFPTEKELVALIPGVDVLIMRVDPQITRAVFDAADKLKVMGVCSVGTNHVDMAYAAEKGVKVINAPGLNANAVAELTLSKMLDLSRDTMTANYDVKINKNWDKYKFVGRELRGRTVGIVGFGKIGRIVGVLARAFQMTTVAYDPYLTQEQVQGENTELLAIDELLRRADYVTIHVPLTPETKDLISYEQLEYMKDDCMLINMSRGGIINEEAAYKALKSGKLGGVAVDVLENELTEGADFDSPLFELDKFIASPHIGAQTVDASRDIGAHIIAKVKEVLSL